MELETVTVDSQLTFFGKGDMSVASTIDVSLQPQPGGMVVVGVDDMLMPNVMAKTYSVSVNDDNDVTVWYDASHISASTIQSIVALV